MRSSARYTQASPQWELHKSFYAKTTGKKIVFFAPCWPSQYWINAFGLHGKNQNLLTTCKTSFLSLEAIRLCLLWQCDCLPEARTRFLSHKAITRCMKSVGRPCFLKPTPFYSVLKHCRIQTREVPDFVSGRCWFSLPERNWAYSEEYKER